MDGENKRKVKKRRSRKRCGNEQKRRSGKEAKVEGYKRKGDRDKVFREQKKSRRGNSGERGEEATKEPERSK